MSAQITAHGASADDATAAALDAQRALLPYALAAFAVGLPIFVWASSYAPDPAWMGATFVGFAIAFGGFYAANDALKKVTDVRRRLRIHMLCGLMWAGAVAEIAIFAAGSGPAREPLLAMALAAAAVVTFFAAPSLPCLLLVGPAAFAGPLIALLWTGGGGPLAVAALSASALALALALLVNRILRRQFALVAETERLARQSAAALAKAEGEAAARSLLLATLSQDVRSGLSAIAQVLSAAVEGRSNPSREQMNAALASTTQMLRAVDATLDNERAEAGELTVAVGPVDAAALLTEVAEEHRAAAAEKGLELRVHIAPELDGPESDGRGAALADPQRLRQVLRHLVCNAVAYTQRGLIELRLERHCDARAAITVADTGPGLSPEELDAAWRAFHRVERTALGVTGAGLGLAVSRKLAHLMGAQLEAESAPGVGSAFTLRLAYDPAAEPPAAAAPDLADQPGAGLRILLVQNDSLALAVTRAALDELGHGVVAAQDGKRALDLAAGNAFDLAIVDADLTGMLGASVIRRLKTLPTLALIEGDSPSAQACAKAGATALVRKPATVPALALAIADAASLQKTPAVA